MCVSLYINRTNNDIIAHRPGATQAAFRAGGEAVCAPLGGEEKMGCGCNLSRPKPVKIQARNDGE